jgi:hypothetical protein
MLQNSNRDNGYGNVTHCYTEEYVEIWAENFQCYAMDSNGNLYSWGLNEVYNN